MKKFKLLSPTRAFGIPGIVLRSPYVNMKERSTHRLHIKNLAEETHRSMQEITPLYEDLLAYWKARAKVHDYLPILISKKVKACLKR